MKGREPREVWRGIELRHAIRNATTAQIHVDGNFLSTAALGSVAPDESGAELSALADAARDLDLVQDRTGTIFAMPDEIDTVQRIWLRALRIILDGGIAPLPRSAVQGYTHPGTTLPDNKDGDLHSSLVNYPVGIIELFGRPLHLGGPLRYPSERESDRVRCGFFAARNCAANRAVRPARPAARVRRRRPATSVCASAKRIESVTGEVDSPNMLRCNHSRRGRISQLRILRIRHSKWR
ncbi:hypothetical protein ACQP0C_10115 [Nocardia sp. CA-129566]|uniref:hypothetical protein n=1 Tax=Nocardia sp. CA-129566 TaxID=3239976 RepID=UPI003D966C26